MKTTYNLTGVAAFISVALGATALIAALVAAASIWSGFVLSILSGWFLVVGFGLAPLSIPLAIGISLIFGFLTGSHRLHKDEKPWTSFALAFAAPAVSLLIGWIVTKFI